MHGSITGYIIEFCIILNISIMISLYNSLIFLWLLQCRPAARQLPIISVKLKVFDSACHLQWFLDPSDQRASFYIIYCTLCSPPTLPCYQRSVIITVFSSLSSLCFPGQWAHLNWCDGVCLCVVDIIPWRVNKGYVPSTGRPRPNKGFSALFCCVWVCVVVGGRPLNLSCSFDMMMNNKVANTGWECVSTNDSWGWDLKTKRGQWVSDSMCALERKEYGA